MESTCSEQIVQPCLTNGSTNFNNHNEIEQDQNISQNVNCSSDKENEYGSTIKQQIIEIDDDDLAENLQKNLLKALNLTEQQWSELNKNQRRKLKKKLRNKIKRQERDEIARRKEIIRKEQKESEKLEIKQEHPDDDDRMEIDEEDAPEEEKELKKLEELKRKKILKNANDIEIE